MPRLLVGHPMSAYKNYRSHWPTPTRVGLPNWVGSVLEVGWLCTAKPNCHPSCLSENSSSFGYFLEPKKTSTMGDSGCGGMGATQLTHILSSLVMSSSRCSAPSPIYVSTFMGDVRSTFLEFRNVASHRSRDHISPLCFVNSKSHLNAIKLKFSPKISQINHSWVLGSNFHQLPSISISQGATCSQKWAKPWKSLGSSRLPTCDETPSSSANGIIAPAWNKAWDFQILPSKIGQDHVQCRIHESTWNKQIFFPAFLSTLHIWTSHNCNSNNCNFGSHPTPAHLHCHGIAGLLSLWIFHQQHSQPRTQHPVLIATPGAIGNPKKGGGSWNGGTPKPWVSIPELSNY